MLISKWYKNFFVLFLIIILLVSLPMNYESTFRPPSLGYLFSTFYFLPIWFIYNGFRVHLTRDMHLFTLNRYHNIVDFFKTISINISKVLFIDISFFLIGTNLLYWVLGGNFRLIYFILYFVVFYLFTFIYRLMLIWSLVFLRTYLPVIIITFLMFFQATFSMEPNPFLNPLLSISTVFTKNPFGYHPNGPPEPYNPEIMLAFFISIGLITLFSLLVIRLKKRRMKL